jgi:hypothetical protein
MHDALRMRFLECIRDLPCNAQRLVERQRSLEILALDTLHDEVVRADVVQRADVGMIQRRHGARLALEAIAELFGGNLDGDFAVQPRVVGTVDLTL